MLAPLTVAVAQPRCAGQNVPANAATHAELIRKARARIVVFPELSLTGYELDADPIALEDPALDVIVGACQNAHSVALVGAPVRGPGPGTYIAVVQIDGTGVTPAYRKCFLGGEERGHFMPGGGPTVIDVDGWRAGLGICKDTGVQQHIDDNAALDIDVYLAGLVHHRHELEIQERRARQIAQACNAYVGLASFAGPTGGGFDQTAGCSSLWNPDGSPIARAGTDGDDFAHATLAPSRVSVS